MGCGVACVAAAVGTTYPRALEYFAGLRGNDRTAGFTRRVLCKALRAAGYTYAFHTFGASRQGRMSLARRLPAGTIVFVRDYNYPRGHYFLRRVDGWMDPQQDRPRRHLPAVPLSYLLPER
jgi:hypothetical protein